MVLCNCLWTDSFDFLTNLFVFFRFLFLRREYFLAQLAGSAFGGPRASCFPLPGAGPGPPARAVGPQPRPLTRSRACPFPLAVFAAMAALSLPAWLALQTRAGTLRAFSTAVSPVTGAPRLSPRECLPRRLQALGAVSGWSTGA